LESCCLNEEKSFIWSAKMELPNSRSAVRKEKKSGIKKKNGLDYTGKSYLIKTKDDYDRWVEIYINELQAAINDKVKNKETGVNR